MIAIIAPEVYERKDNDITCFLAGGITGCDNWQQEVIQFLEMQKDFDNVVVFSPRQVNFNVNDPNGAEKQIKWEFDQLSRMDIFSMYFCRDQIQPICLYELGRYIAKMEQRFPYDWKSRCIITVEEDYPRTQDVIFQMKFAGLDNVVEVVDRGDYAKHAYKIVEAIKALKQ